jgi:hypothetical protein
MRNVLFLRGRGCCDERCPVLMRHTVLKMIAVEVRSESCGDEGWELW